MAPVVSALRKVVTAEEIRTGRFHVPAGVRNNLFRHLALNEKTALTMVDEIGKSHAVVLNMRGNGTKPEIMSRGGKKFAIQRNLVAGAILEFSRSNLPGHFKVRVHPPAELQPPIFHQSRQYLIGFDRRSVTEPPQTEIPAVLGLCGVSAQTQQLGFGSFIGSDHLLGEPLKATSMSMELGLGISIGPVQPPSLANMQLKPLTATLELVSSMNIQATTPEEAHVLDLSLAIGTNLVPLTLGRVKSEAQEVTSPTKTKPKRPFYGGLYPDLSLSLEYSNFLPEQKPRRALSTAKPGYSAFSPYVPRECNGSEVQLINFF